MATETIKSPNKIVGAGEPVLATFNNDLVSESAGETPTEKTETSPDTELPELTDEQIKAIFEKKGITGFDGDFDSLKKKLNPEAKPQEQTAEEKEAAEQAFEKRMLDHFIENGGTPESFVSLKQVASADLKILSEAQIKKELHDAGFDENEIGAVLKERYYQINIDSLEQGDDETDDDFDKRKKDLEKKIAYGSKKFEQKSTFIKKEAENALNTLREAINLQDLLSTKEKEISSNVDEIVSKMPRKVTLELGASNDKDISPIPFDVNEEYFAEIAGVLKDPAQRKQLLYNEDNSLNLSRISELLLKEKMFSSAIKVGFLEGGSRQVGEFEKIFPGVSAKEIGIGGQVGGKTNGRKGHIVSAGQPEPVVHKA